MLDNLSGINKEEQMVEIINNINVKKPAGIAKKILEESLKNNNMEANVYDLIAKRFISVFYPDCKFSTTTVLGEVINEDGPKPEKIEFKVSGKEILEPGWRVVYAKDVKNADDDDASDNANGNADSGNGAKKEV